MKNVPPHHMSNITVIRRAIGLMSRREVYATFGLLLLMLVAGVLESTVVAAVLPFVYVLVDPASAAANPKIAEVLNLLGLDQGNALPVLSVTLVAALVLASLTSALVNYLNEHQTELSRLRLARAILERIVNAPYLWMIRRDSSTLVKAIYDDVRIWRRDCLQSLLNLVQAVILIIFPAVAATLLAPMSGLLALVVLGVCSAFIMMLIRRPILNMSKNARELHSKTVSTLQQVLVGVREVKVSRKAVFFLGAFDKWHSGLNRVQMQVRLLSRLPASLLTLLGQVGFVLIAFLFWKEGYSGVEITAQIAVIGLVVTRVLPAVNRLNAGLATLLGSLAYVEGLLNILDSTDKDQGWLASGSHGKVPIPKDWKALQLQGAGFGFGEGGGIWDLDIELKRGKFYGVVGRSGAGKSTLLNLLLGLIEPTQGRILIDGVERQRLDPAAWLDQLAYVPQDVFLLDDTLEANIIFGTQREDATVCMGNALKIASLDTLIPELPEGMATRLGERGRRFSGGQAQRVAIARAMFNRPTILLMDEATSALDSITESDVQNAIAELGDDTLVIAISHRVSSLKNCDDIIVVDAGRIADVGSYDELMQRNHLFADLAANTEKSLVES